MSTQTYRVYPIADFCVDGGFFEGWGTHAAAGVSSEGSGDCSTYLDDPVDALDETTYGAIRSRATAAAYNATSRFEFTLTAPPSGITVTKVRLVAWMRTSNAGGASIDESPRVKGFVNPAGTRYYQSGPSYVTVANPRNRNTEGPTGSFARHVVGEWATNPATASAWTLADLASGVFKAGVEAGGIAEGQAGNGVPPTTGGSGASWDTALFVVEIDGSPSELVIDPLRQLLSRLLRFRRRALRPVSIVVPATLCDVEPGEIVYVGDPFWPTGDGAGVAPLAWAARPVAVLSSQERPSSHLATLEGWDLRDAMASLWSPLHTDLGADDQWTGIAWMDRGGGKSVTRAQGGWTWRPGDLLRRDAPSGKWRITPWGLLVCGGGGTGEGKTSWWPENNTFSQGSGTTFTGWTGFTAGTGALAEETATYALDAAGYRRAVKFANGGAPPTDTAYVYTTGTAAGLTNYKIRVHYRYATTATTAAGHAQWLLYDTASAKSYVPGSGWLAGSNWNLPTAGSASVRQMGDQYAVWSEEITVNPGGTATLRLYVGYSSVPAVVTRLYEAGLIYPDTTSGAGARAIRREFLATTTVAATQAADAIYVDNQSAYRVWFPDAGTAHLCLVPLWKQADLDDNDTKHVLVAMIDSGYAGGAAYMALSLKRTSSTNVRAIFEVFRGGGSLGSAYADLGQLSYFGGPIKLSCRWTGSAGELGLAARTLDVFAAGAKGTSGAASAGLTAVESSKVYLGSYPAGTAYSYLDGIMAHLELKPFCLTDDEILRAQSQMTIPTLPTVVAG